MLHDPGWIDALCYQLILDDQAIRNYPMRQPKRAALRALLHRRTKAVCLTFVSHPRRHPRYRCGRHSENVCVKVVRVNYVDLVVFQEAGQALRSSLLEAIDHVENVWFHFTPPSEPDFDSSGPRAGCRPASQRTYDA